MIGVVGDLLEQLIELLPRQELQAIGALRAVLGDQSPNERCAIGAFSIVMRPLWRGSLVIRSCVVTTACSSPSSTWIN